MTDFKTYIYQTASNKKFVYRCPHCNKGIMQVAEIKTVKDETNIYLGIILAQFVRKRLFLLKKMVVLLLKVCSLQ